MASKGASVRNRRFDNPFDPNMNQAELAKIMKSKLFADLDAGRFPDHLTPEDIARNDTRLVRMRRGDIVVRQGDYGNTAYFVLQGSLKAVAAAGLTQAILGKRPKPQRGLLASLKRFASRHAFPEFREIDHESLILATRLGDRGSERRAYFQDVDEVIAKYEPLDLLEGELFGEIAALSRNPRVATVFAETNCLLIEIRWQGLRDIMRRDPGLRHHVMSLYRERSMPFHIKNTQLFQHLTDGELSHLADAARFDGYGDLANADYGGVSIGKAETRLDHEPLICEEGDYINALGIICSGFVRQSVRVNFGHRTITYLGRGQYFGLDEIAHNHTYEEKVGLQHSYRAVGFCDILWLPVPVVEQYVLPHLKQTKPIVAAAERGRFWEEVEQDKAIDEGLMEFVVDERFHNGSAAMVINLDRCTGCDDCVRACAATHDNNPRFVRHGKRFGNLQVASACMHCVDPTCLIGCPTGAIYRSGESTLVDINPETCIGCSSCANNCSYNNIRMVPVRDGSGQLIWDEEIQAPMIQATKCDLCSSEPMGPACQYACPHDALIRLDLRDMGKLAKWGLK